MAISMEYYKVLSYSIDAEKFAKEIENLLKYYEEGSLDFGLEINLMCELSAREYLVCENLDEHLKNKIDEWLYKRITSNSSFDLGICFAIVDRFSLKKTLCFLENEYLSDLIKNHNTIKYYESLQDYPSADYLLIEFKRLLNILRGRDCNLVDILSSMYELAIRQLHTYEDIDKNFKQELEKELIKIIDYNSKVIDLYSGEVIELSGGVALNLDMKNICMFMKEKMCDIQSESVKQIMQKIVMEDSIAK